MTQAKLETEPMTISEIEKMIDTAANAKERETWQTLLAIKTQDPERIRKAVRLAVNRVGA